MKNRDRVILKKVLEYANDIEYAIQRFQLDEASFMKDRVARHSISMCILQIGELAGNLTADFILTYTKVPWRAMIGMRHRAAPDYSVMDKKVIWETAIKHVPELKAYCDAILLENPRL
ncbi:MAG: DUF86 domain-containing protein [Turicibacter sp.]|nr:DUF86 domain-containing protein [Turicibacter sp.]